MILSSTPHTRLVVFTACLVCGTHPSQLARHRSNPAAAHRACPASPITAEFLAHTLLFPLSHPILPPGIKISHRQLVHRPLGRQLPQSAILPAAFSTTTT